MKIALLNLPIDNNYGGNLQRVALVRVLEEMGHEVTHLMTTFLSPVPGRWIPYTIAKRIVRRVLKRTGEFVFPERHSNSRYMATMTATLPFYEKYVKHTKALKAEKDLKKYSGFEAYIVGSDQVWRYSMIVHYPFSSMFLDFVERKKDIKRIAYGVSFGTTENEIPKEDIPRLKSLYCKFDAVSVREDTGLKHLASYEWLQPKAVQVLDPTLLLSKDDYIAMIQSAQTTPSDGNMFCYVLDQSSEVKATIEQIAKKRGLKPFQVSITGEQVSVEQWLRSFMDSEYIVTDSYHGFVFSIIFNKPVCLTYNKFRGNDRFESLQRLLDYHPEEEQIDWERINRIIKEMAMSSRQFLKNSLVK